MQDTITIGVILEHIELSELNVFIGWTLTCIRHSTFQTLCTCHPSDLKSALLIDTLNVLVFYWAERVRH